MEEICADFIFYFKIIFTSNTNTKFSTSFTLHAIQLAFLVLNKDSLLCFSILQVHAFGLFMVSLPKSVVCILIDTSVRDNIVHLFTSQPVK